MWEKENIVELLTNRIAGIIRDSEIRQSVIAQVAELSDSSLSMIIHGTALPTPGKMLTLASMLRISKTETSELLAMLHAAKVQHPEIPVVGGEEYAEGDDDIYSDDKNPDAEKTDIVTWSDQNEDENNDDFDVLAGNEYADYDEIVRRFNELNDRKDVYDEKFENLKKRFVRKDEDGRDIPVYDQDSDLWHALELMHNFESYHTSDTPSLKLLFNDPSQSGVPVILLSEMKNFTTQSSLREFVYSRSHDIAFRDYGVSCSPVIINAIGTEIGINYVGMVQLTVADDMLNGFSSLKLAFYGKKNGFRLLSENPVMSGGIEVFMQHTPLPDKPTVWILPVLEFAILPFLTSDSYTTLT